MLRGEETGTCTSKLPSLEVCSLRPSAVCVPSIVAAGGSRGKPRQSFLVGGAQEVR